MPKATIYVWAKVPEGYTSAEFATKILDEANVIVAAGSAYGPSGEGYVRISLTTPDDRLEEAHRTHQEHTLRRSGPRRTMTLPDASGHYEIASTEQDRAVLVGIDRPRDDGWDLEEDLAELGRLDLYRRCASRCHDHTAPRAT